MKNVPEEIERKYLIQMPDLSKLRLEAEFSESEIEQIYLASEEGETKRIRKRERDGKATFTKTTKIRIDEMSCFEDEHVITEDEYMSLKKEIAPASHPILKKRVTFLFEGQLLEVDIYPFWKNTAVLECELKSREDSVKIPPCLTLIKEVTGDRRFSNSSLSFCVVPEDQL